MISFIFKTIAGLLLLVLLLGFGRTWQMEHSENQKLFLTGKVPNPALSGFYKGIVPGYKFSWAGKKFDSINNKGINVFDNASSTQVDKYPFVTSTGKGITDENIDVLKIDYDINGNPFWLRFILDEVVETTGGQYLGKLQLRLIWKFPFTLGFFNLSKGDELELDGNKTYTEGENTFLRFWSSDLGLSFAYLLEPNGYKFIEEDIKKINDSTIEKYFTIVNKKEYEELMSSTIPREGPPQISVLVFKNESGKPANDWIKEHGKVINYSITSKLLGVDFAGTKGVRYKAEGLYADDVVVLENNYRIYVFIGSYNDENDKIRKDFLDLLKTINLF